MRIVHVSPYFPPNIGGVEKVVEWEAAFLAEQGHEVTVLTSFAAWPTGSVNTPDVEEVSSIAVRRLAFRRPMHVLGKPLLPTPANMARLVHLEDELRACRPEIIHVHHLVPSVVRCVVRYARASSTRLFFQPYFHPYDRPRLAFVRDRANLATITLASARGTLIMINNSEAGQIETHFALHIPRQVTIPIPVAWARHPPAFELHSSRPIVLCVARLDEARKGHAFLIAGLNLLKDLPWQLVLVGRGNGTVVRRELALAGLSDRAIFCGELPENELISAYDNADVFAMPSQYEGFGIPFVEAMRRGVPVVGTLVGAIPELVGDAGALVPYGDAAALARELRKLLTDQNHRYELALRGYHRSLRYLPSAIGAQLTNLYTKD